MAECFVSEVKKDINSSSKLSSDVPSCQDVKTKEVMEPLLLEDFQRSKIPISLINILKFFEEQGTTPSKTDFLAGCVYVLMLEYGFIPQRKGISFGDSAFNYSRIKELSSGLKENISQGSKNGCVYTASFVLPPDELYVCKISCIKIGDGLVINASVRNIKNANYTVMLDILSYFTDGVNQCANYKSVQNMSALSRLFKDQIAFPIRHTVLGILGQRCPCLEDLPLELIHHIFKYIRGSDIVRLTSTCKRLYTCRQDAKLWKYICRRDFGITRTEEDYIELLKIFGQYRRSSRGRLYPNPELYLVL